MRQRKAKKDAKSGSAEAKSKDIGNSSDYQKNSSVGFRLRSYKSFDITDWMILAFGVFCIGFGFHVYLKYNTGRIKEKEYTVGSFGQKVEKTNSKGLEETPIYSDPSIDGKLFSHEELLEYSAVKDGPTYIAILGEVYDVSGAPFYEVNGGYEFFSGKDGSYGFITGRPEDAKEMLPDSVTPANIANVLDWTMFYRSHDSYKFKGKVNGAYWNEQGKSTSLRDNFITTYHDIKKKSADEEIVRKRYPYCRQKYIEQDSDVVKYWCDEGRILMLEREGFNPTSLLVPRIMFSPVKNGDRCGCIEIDIAAKDPERFKPFPDCEKDSEICLSKYLR